MVKLFLNMFQVHLKFKVSVDCYNVYDTLCSLSGHSSKDKLGL